MRYPETQIQSQEGINYISSQVNDMSCIWREITVHDVGIDGHIELVQNNEPTGLLLAVQCKSGMSYMKNEKQDRFFYYPKKADLKYWSINLLPVVLIIYSPRDKVGYWLDIKSYVRNNPLPSQGSYRIIFKKRVFDKNAKNDLFTIARKYFEILEKNEHILLDIDDDVQEILDQGREAFEHKRYVEALQLSYQVLDFYPNYYGAIRQTGRLLCAMQKYGEAYDLYHRCVKDNFTICLPCRDSTEGLPQFIVLPFKEWWFDSGLCRLFLEECSKNIYFLEERLKLSAKSHLLIADLAVALAFCGRKSEAVKFFEKATNLSPNDAVYWHQRGLNHRNLSEIDNAFYCFERALEIEPDYERAKDSLLWMQKHFLKRPR